MPFNNPVPGIYKIRNGNVRYVAENINHQRPLTPSECDKYGVNWGWATLQDYTVKGRCLRGWTWCQRRQSDLIELIVAVDPKSEPGSLK